MHATMVVQAAEDGGQSGWPKGWWRWSGCFTAQLGQPERRGTRQAAWSCLQRRWQAVSKFRRPLNQERFLPARALMEHPLSGRGKPGTK
eukprot:10553925-Lingulodinium_polyedra.AAC.1